MTTFVFQPLKFRPKKLPDSDKLANPLSFLVFLDGMSVMCVARDV
jgi:hypothetical protein